MVSSVRSVFADSPQMFSTVVLTLTAGVGSERKGSDMMHLLRYFYFFIARVAAAKAMLVPLYRSIVLYFFNYQASFLLARCDLRLGACP